jgi:hypothetical protein
VGSMKYILSKKKSRNEEERMLGRRMTDDRRRTIDEKCEVQVFLAGEAAAGDAAVVETALESVGSREHCWQ